MSAGILVGVVVATMSVVLLSGDASAAKKKRKGHHDADAHAAHDAGTKSKDASSHTAPATTQTSTASTAAWQSDGGLGCLYGKVMDGHTGKERCLSPEEMSPPRNVIVDTRALAEELGMLHDTEPETPSPDGGDEADGGDKGGSGAFKARVASVSFENGAVGRVNKALEKVSDEMAACVADNGGLKAESARLKLMFLVRPRGKPEGIIVASARNIPPRVVRCITKIVEVQSVGAPSNDPVGVTVVIELKERDD